MPDRAVEPMESERKTFETTKDITCTPSSYAIKITHVILSRQPLRLFAS